MLSDEEKKAIDNMKSLLLYSKEHEYFSPFQEQEIDDMNIVLNLIEKQQKEIEELKEKNKPQPDCAEPVERTEEMVNMRWVNYNYISKDKIKAKIEEINEKLEYDWESEYEYCKEVLQSLLEKE